MAASAMLLPRHPPTLVGMTAMRLPAPTLPVMDPETATIALPRGAEWLVGTVGHGHVAGRHDDDHQDGVDEDETTELRSNPRLEHVPSPPDTRVSSFTDETVTQRGLRLRETLDDLDIIEVRASGIVPAMSPAAADAVAGVRSDTLVRNAPHEITRIDGPRLRTAPSQPAQVLRTPPPMYLPLAHAATAVAQPISVALPIAVAQPISVAQPVANVQTMPYAPPITHAPPMPFAFVPAPSRTAQTSRTQPAKRKGSLLATFGCGVMATGMAVIALAESPVATRPELAPYAVVVRREARDGARTVSTVATAGWARARALVKRAASV